MKTILAAWIAAILLLLLASIVLAGPDEDARAALALSGAKPTSTSDYYGVLWKQDEEIMFSVRQSNGLNRLYRVKCTSADCEAAVAKLADTEKVVVIAGKDVPVPGRYCDDLAADSVREVQRAAPKSPAQVCFTGELMAEYGEFVLLTATDHYLLTLTPDQENDCKALVMSDRGKSVQMCGHLDGSHSLVVESIGGMGAKADAPSANQQKQIDALPPGTVYQWRRPDGTLSEPRTKPGTAPMTQPQRYDRPFMQFAPMMGRACVGSA